MRKLVTGLHHCTSSRLMLTPLHFSTYNNILYLFEWIEGFNKYSCQYLTWL